MYVIECQMEDTLDIIRVVWSGHPPQLPNPQLFHFSPVAIPGQTKLPYLGMENTQYSLAMCPGMT